MLDGELSLDLPELETPAIEPSSTPAPDAELETPAIGEDGQELPQEPEEDDLEFGFKKYRVPKELKEGVEKLRASFTQKTQEYASKESDLEARAAQQLKADEEELDARAQLHHVGSQLQRYEKMGWAEWQQLRNTDPASADEHWQYFQLLKDQRTAAERKVSEATDKRSQAAQSDMTKRFEETEKFARENIKGWTPEIDKKVIEFARGKGLSDQFLRQNMSPTLYEFAYLAQLGEQLLKRQAAPKPKPAPEPLETVTPKGTVPSSKPSDKDSTDVWMEKWRKKQARG